MALQLLFAVPGAPVMPQLLPSSIVPVMLISHPSTIIS
jgi:hypothetical protein